MREALKKPTTRIHVILARGSRTAVVFRRGPAKRVLLLRWDLARNVLEEGQWLAGHIYERRCDLSPSGEYLAYFAAKWKGKYPSYTAISRPPWLTALALWRGDGAWGGGGLFQDDRTFLLSPWSTPRVDEGHVDPRFTVAPFSPTAGRGEEPWGTRLHRDGWLVVQQGGQVDHADWSGKEITVAGEQTRVWWPVDPPMIHERAQPGKPGARLQMRICGFHEIQGPWYVIEHAVLDANGEERWSLGRSDWADWDATGALVFAKDGCLREVPRTHVLDADAEAKAKLLFDLRDRTFVSRQAPPWARDWRSRRPR